MNTWQTAYEQDRQQMLQEIYEKIGNYIQHWWAIEWWWWKVYDTISLAWVLSALGKMWMFSYTPWHIEQYHVDWKWQTICLRKLLNESWEDAYLDEQSDGTIKVLHELLVRK